MKNRITSYLNEILPNATCELNHNKDYELLISVMLSAQTTDKRVNSVTKILFSEYTTLESLALANIEDIKKIIRPIGTFNKKSANLIEIAKRLIPIGYIENDREFIESLPGVGRKTANVVLANLYNVECIAVDTHVARVSKRLAIAEEDDSVEVIEKKLNNFFDKKDLRSLHHQLVLFGRYYCCARSPKCSDCKLNDICKYAKKNSK